MKHGQVHYSYELKLIIKVVLFMKATVHVTRTIFIYSFQFIALLYRENESR